MKRIFKAYLYAPMNLEDLWKASLGEIEITISKAQFNTWFRGTSILSLEEGKVTISVPNGFAKEWLENKYHIIILRALGKHNKDIKSVSCQVVQSPPQKPVSTGIDAVSARPQSIQHSGFQTFPIKEKTDLSTPYSHTFRSSNLNPRYTFSHFIVGENNNLAFAACQAVGEQLGTLYNPLFLYGGVGLGKTHLLQSIGNHILAQDPNKEVLYTTTEKFTHELISAIKNNTINDFKARYQKIDLLIIDDVQFLSGREKTQHEFFNIFNTLYQRDKQIVISSDRPPKLISTLQDRLRSRFEGGMIADIGRPGFETRLAILESKALEKKLTLPRETLEYIAQNITHNIRELEGALNRVVAFSQLQNIEASPSLAEKALGDLINTGKKKTITQNDIVETVCAHYDILPEELSKKGRKKEIAKPRHVAMFLLRTELNTSFKGIGRCFGGRDHTTALHAYEKISSEIQNNLSLKEEVSLLREKLYIVE